MFRLTTANLNTQGKPEIETKWEFESANSKCVVPEKIHAPSPDFLLLGGGGGWGRFESPPTPLEIPVEPHTCTFILKFWLLRPPTPSEFLSMVWIWIFLEPCNNRATSTKGCEFQFKIARICCKYTLIFNILQSNIILRYMYQHMR